jgi:hypothetical protein
METHRAGANGLINILYPDALLYKSTIDFLMVLSSFSTHFMLSTAKLQGG